ncbi:Anoctamin-8 [Dermatophagoides pteronyssinus]|uniref:Anoctamin n=1 Tax=Dermatophagoides pteronyssinus TaxID=6956 RepID=A0ABQ8IW43_DERPT|nr:Anoctamin-8 [Dermatophagoides pteronyssinus]
MNDSKEFITNDAINNHINDDDDDDFDGNEKLSSGNNSSLIIRQWLQKNFDFDKNRDQLRESCTNLFYRNENKSDIVDKYDLIITFKQQQQHSTNDNNDDLNIELINNLMIHLRLDFPGIMIELRKHHRYQYALYVGGTNQFFEKYIEKKNRLSKKSNDDDQHYRYFPFTNIFSSLQRQTILIDLLSNWRFHQRNDDVDDKLALYMAENDLIIDKLLQTNQIIDQLFALHHEQDLDQLKMNWVAKFFHQQPLDQICSYFGIRIAIYFAFIGFYTEYLVYPMLYGIFIVLFPYLFDYLPSISLFNLIDLNWQYFHCIISFLFPVFNIFWSTLWLNRWQTNCHRLTKRWIRFIPEWPKTNDNNDDDDDKSERKNDDNNHNQFIDLIEKIFQYCFTFPIIGFCLILTFTVMFKIFIFQTWWDEELIERLHYPTWTGIIPKIIFALILNVINYFYYLIVIWLNEKEKHQNFERKENQLIVKLFLFQFLNSYLPLFYIAFYLTDMNKLKEQLAAQLITRQVIDKDAKNETTENELSKGELESCMYGYHTTFDDYLEIIIQYGYIMLFATIFPLASLCAFLNNLIEIRTDAFKLCFVYQRPFIDTIIISRHRHHRNHHNRNRQSPTITIGVWKNVLEFLGIIAIISNCALMAIDNGQEQQFGCLFSSSSSSLMEHSEYRIIFAVIIEVTYIIIDKMANSDHISNQYSNHHHHHHHRRNPHDPHVNDDYAEEWSRIIV